MSNASRYVSSVNENGALTLLKMSTNAYYFIINDNNDEILAEIDVNDSSLSLEIQRNTVLVATEIDETIIQIGLIDFLVKFLNKLYDNDKTKNILLSMKSKSNTSFMKNCYVLYPQKGYLIDTISKILESEHSDEKKFATIISIIALKSRLSFQLINEYMTTANAPDYSSLDSLKDLEHYMHPFFNKKDSVTLFKGNTEEQQLEYLAYDYAVNVKNDKTITENMTQYVSDGYPYILDKFSDYTYNERYVFYYFYTWLTINHSDLIEDITSKEYYLFINAIVNNNTPNSNNKLQDFKYLPKWVMLSLLKSFITFIRGNESQEAKDLSLYYLSSDKISALKKESKKGNPELINIISNYKIVGLMYKTLDISELNKLAIELKDYSDYKYNNGHRLANFIKTSFNNEYDLEEFAKNYKKGIPISLLFKIFKD